MKCMSCTADIPPAWVNAIQRNECPGCGGEIMDIAAKQLLDELTDAMIRMPNDPQGVAGWLLSNYRLAKMGEHIEPTEKFHRQSKTRAASDSNEQSLAIADNTVQKFLKRTGQSGKLAENNAKLAKLAQQLKKGDSAKEQYGDGMDAYDDDIEMGDEDDEDYTPAPALAKKLLANNVIMSTGENEQPLGPEEVAKLMQKVAESGDLKTGSQALQLQRMERLEKQKGIADGTGQGSFRRGD